MKTLPTILFLLYFLLLVKLILVKGPLFYEVVPTSEEYISKSADSSLVSYNLVPFSTIRAYFHNDTLDKEIAFNVFGNVLLFIPYGFLLPLVFRKRVILFDIFYTAILVSFCFELFQFITKTGQFDVDDIILNTVGAVAGYWILKLGERLLETKPIRRRSKMGLSRQL